MQTKISKEKVNFIKKYIDELESQFAIYEGNIEYAFNENLAFDKICEIIKIFKDEIPELDGSVLLMRDSSERDAKVVIGILKKYLIDNGYIEKTKTASSLERFWLSFKTYFDNELPSTGILKDEFINYTGWDNENLIVDIDYEYQFNLHYGIEYDESNFNDINNIKLFIELAYDEWIKSDKKYEFTIKVNKIFKKMKLPYKLSKGKIIGEGYKTSFICKKILNYAMFERKIAYAEEMILSTEVLDKKCALDYIVDSLLYIISIQKGDKLNEKYESIALLISNDRSSKQYNVLYNEIKELIKISNEYFDIRHNEYLNKAKEVREPINNSIFIEYLYNRVYALLYLIRIKYEKSQIN